MRVRTRGNGAVDIGIPLYWHCMAFPCDQICLILCGMQLKWAWTWTGELGIGSENRGIKCLFEGATNVCVVSERASVRVCDHFVNSIGKINRRKRKLQRSWLRRHSMTCMQLSLTFARNLVSNRTSKVSPMPCILTHSVFAPRQKHCLFIRNQRYQKLCC